MIKLRNPFLDTKDKDYKCFGCSPLNKNGLQLEFWEDENAIVSIWKPKKHLEGYLNVLHGGIQATLHDEIASWTIYVKCGVAGVTSKIDVKYKHPVMIDDNEITIRGEVVEQNRRFATIKTTIQNSQGKICSEGQVTYFLFSKDDSVNKYQYPGVEAFYPERVENN